MQPSSGNETKTNWEIEINAVIQPATDTGVLFALVTEEASVPLSLSLIDYHSTKKLKQQVQTNVFVERFPYCFLVTGSNFQKHLTGLLPASFFCPTCSEHGLEQQCFPDNEALPLTGVCQMLIGSSLQM